MANYQKPSGGTFRESETVGDITYIGYSNIGEALDADTWSIKKIETVGDKISVTYGDGAWNDRATLIYE